MTTIYSHRARTPDALDLMAERCGDLKALLTRCQLQVEGLKKAVADAADTDISQDAKDFLLDELDFISTDLEDTL